MRWEDRSAKERHRPPHEVTAGTALFITAATVRRIPYLGSASRRDGFLALLQSECERFEMDLIAWVVLKEHYHLVMVPGHPEVFEPWITSIHSNSARPLNEEEGTPGRQVWYQYWDTTLWTEGDLWSRISYVHRNPVKHGYVDDPADWPWSSYRQMAEYLASEDAVTRIARFPAPRKLPHDDF